MSRSVLRGVAAAVVLGCCSAPFAAAADQPAPIQLQQVVRRLDHPVHITNDGVAADRLYVVEQNGDIRVIDHGQLRPQAYLDIADHVTAGGECGLLSVAFHPKFARNGLLYVDYTAGHGGSLHTVVSEFHVDSPDAESVNAGTERVLLTIHQPQSNHNGGQLQFGPDDGCLYIGTGDGGAGNDQAEGHIEPTGNGQSKKTLLAKILRIDVDHKDPGKQYAVPKDNPFVGEAGAQPEIWALGLRNPWRFSFDRQSHLLYAGDVGQDLWEEVDVITKGGNYGWRIREGLHPFNVPKNLPPDLKLIDPIKEYRHPDGISITGGFVYRGTAIPDLQGWYLYADYGKAWVAALKYEDGKVTGDVPRLLTKNIQISSFGEDKAGELYVCDHGNGAVYKIVAR